MIAMDKFSVARALDEISRYLADAGVIGYEQDWLADRAQTDFNLTDPDAYLKVLRNTVRPWAIRTP